MIDCLARLRDGADRVWREDRFDLRFAAGDRVNLGLIGRRGQTAFADAIDRAADQGHLLPEGVRGGSRFLVGAIEAIHARGASFRLRVDLLEHLGTGDELFGLHELLAAEGRILLGEGLRLVERVHHLEPAIPEPGHVSLDFFIKGQRFPAHGRLEIRVFGRQQFEPFLEGIEPVHDLDRVLAIVLDLAFDRIARPPARHPDEARDDETDGDEGRNKCQYKVAPSGHDDRRVRQQRARVPGAGWDKPETTHCPGETDHC